jgi:hypothetical protein
MTHFSSVRTRESLRLYVCAAGARGPDLVHLAGGGARPVKNLKKLLIRAEREHLPPRLKARLQDGPVLDYLQTSGAGNLKRPTIQRVALRMVKRVWAREPLAEARFFSSRTMYLPLQRNLISGRDQLGGAEP